MNTDDLGVDEDADDLQQKISRNPELFSACPTRQRKLFSFDWAKGFGAPFIATPDRTVAAIATKVSWKQNDVICDLGCGNGSLLLGLLKRIQAVGVNATYIGIDLDDDLIIEAREAARTSLSGDGGSSISLKCGQPAEQQLQLQEDGACVEDLCVLQSEVSFHAGDILTYPLRGVTCILLFLLPNMLDKLGPRLAEFLAGADSNCVISVTWPLPPCCKTYLLGSIHTGARDLQHDPPHVIIDGSQLVNTDQAYTDSLVPAHADESHHMNKKHGNGGNTAGFADVVHVYSQATWRLL